MKIGVSHYVCLGLPILLCACGSDTPSFVEKPESIITLSVDESATTEQDENSFDVDELIASEELSPDASTAGVAGDLEEEFDAKDSTDHDKASGNSGKIGNSADATAETNTPDSGTTGSSAGPSYDAKAVAKACLPHFRGLSQKIKVIDPDSASNLSVAPGTIIAFKMTGNYSKLTVNLPAGNDLPGVCFFLSGHEADVKFSTASLIEGFAYLASGDQSSGAIEFLGGSPVRSHIEMKGHQPALDVLGLDADLCQNANLSGNARFQCNP